MIGDEYVGKNMKIGFRFKVLAAIAAIAISVSIIMSWFFLYRSRNDIENNYIESIWKAMHVSLDSFDENMREAYKKALFLSYDETLFALADGFKGENIENALAISDYLAGQQEIENIKHIYLYLPEEEKIITSNDYHYIQDFEAYRDNWLEEKMKIGLYPELIYDRASNTPEHILSYRRQLKGGSSRATVCVNMDERRIYYRYLTGSTTGENEEYFLISEDNMIVSSSVSGYIGQKINAALGIEEEKFNRFENSWAFTSENDQLIAGVSSPFTGMRLVAVSDRKQLTASLESEQRMIFGFLLLVLLAALGFAYPMSGRVYAPVKKLKDAMIQVGDGDLSVRAPVQTSDEIGQLSKGFNQMIEQIETLIGDLVSEQMKKKEAELEALQYQITPHFMYNTLNSIKYAAILEGNEAVGEQIGAFIELLQVSAQKKGAFITVREEIKMVKNYVLLQKFRYGDSFSVDFKIQPDAEEYYVPRLILQPLVENAILHGQKAPDESGKIQVTVSTAMETLVLSVQDEGKGMSKAEVNLLTSGKGKNKQGLSGIGVSNIIERLRLYYGEKAHLKMTSSEHGTNAVIDLPLTKNKTFYEI